MSVREVDAGEFCELVRQAERLIGMPIALIAGAAPDGYRFVLSAEMLEQAELLPALLLDIAVSLRNAAESL